MASKFELLSALYDDVSKKAVRSPDNWQDFLTSACRNYRLRFDEQLLVYSQRPNATAVLEFDRWNRRFNRKILRGSKGIAVFSDGGRKQIKYYFDISDTEEREKSVPVPVWQYRNEYEAAVTETLENSFGELEKKDSLYNAVMSVTENITEDNLPDYLSDLLQVCDDSYLEELDREMISSMYRTIVKNSVAFMVLTRLGFNAEEYFERDDFQAVVNFNTPDTLNLLGFATSDLAQTALYEIAKTVKSLEKENRTFAENDRAAYTKAENKNERSADDDAVHIHDQRRSSDTELTRFGAGEFDFGQIFADEETISQGKSQGDLLQLPDERNLAESSVGDRAESESNGGNIDETDVGTGGLDGGTQGSRPNGLGAGNEQPETESTGDSNERGDLQPVTDELPPFTDSEMIISLIKNPNDHLTHSKEFLVKTFSELTDEAKPGYISTLYAGKWEEIGINGTTVGYKQEKDGLLLYEGNYRTRTKESVFSWPLVAELMQNLIDNDEYLPKKEQAEPARSSQELQSDNSISTRPFIQSQKEHSDKTEPAQFSLFDFDNIPQGANIETNYNSQLNEAYEIQNPPAPNADLAPDSQTLPKHDYNFRDKEIETLGKKERFRRNIMAIQLLKKCQEENRLATPEEQEILSGYVGWGGIPEAFDENNSAWVTEFSELSAVLSPDEYRAARASTLTSFYTPQPVIAAIYKALDNLGFKAGNILEPCCAIGNFIGMLPENMQGSKFYGVEIDGISSGIAQQLYQTASVMTAPFEKAELPDSFFDAVVGNVPFGDYKLNDKRYDKYNFLIHDYFFAKSLDKLRPGGVMCLITSKGTMDKENANVRRYLAERADLLGAIRLPDNTFKGNAGTRVTSDILFLQKRDRMFDIEPDWVQLDTDENGIRMNKYFVTHPDMVLGEMVMESGRFKPETACKAFENSDLSELLDKAASNIRGEITAYSVDDELPEDDEEYIPADPDVRNFSFTISDGKIYFRENSLMRKVKAGITAENRMKGMIAVRDSTRRLIELQQGNASDDEIRAEQSKLNSVYDRFVEKYGYINSRANASVFSEDSSYFLICSLEIFTEGKFERKADMFTKRTIQPHKVKTHADTSVEAYGISIGEKAKVDMEYMCQLTGKSEDEIFNDLSDTIFLNPDYSENADVPKYLPADEYLSGNVLQKFRQAKALAEKDERFKINAAALEKVQPVPLKANEISVQLGSTWLPVEYVEQFMYELLDTPFYLKYKIKVHYNEIADAWNIEHKSADNSNLNVVQKYGTKRKNAYHIIESTLNLRNVKVFDYVEDDNGKRTPVLNREETALAQQKQKIIKQKFKDWIWREPERREKLCSLYNEKFNCIRPREYDGSHIIFEGMNPEITLRPNQRNAAARGIYGGNSLLAHCVGAGKTYTMAAIAQESKRLGLCSKSLFIVPNHIVSQWATEYLQLYPSANILAAAKKDFETKNRKKFCARIATGDYDAIIIGHSQFEKIPLSVGRQIFNINEQIEEIVKGIADLKAAKGERFTVKALELTKEKLETKLEKLNDQSRKDDVVTFEELGVDRIFVDEAHYYKNLFVYSKMRNVGGISQTEAQKSSDLFMKCRYLDELTDKKGVIFATGTPISNSMVELYTMQRYLQYDLLRDFGYVNFDSWAAQYGEIVTAMELAPEGTGYRMKTRFARFNNLPELMSIFRLCADIQTADMLKLPVPNAVYKNISVKPSEIQLEMVSDLAERAESIRKRFVRPYEDNMLKITNDGRKLALDQRLINPALPDFAGGKVNECIQNIYDIWENTAEKKSTQLVFCDLSTPGNNAIETEAADGAAQMTGFQNVYRDIRYKLIQKGVPPEEIAFIHDAKNDKQKAELFAKVRSGKVRVLLGSTQKMGAGTNVQNKLIAIHNIDCPWRPSDLEQRAGRIIRQGNENDEVYVYRYVTENTFDAYLYQLVETKQKFIGQVMTGKTPMRSVEDVDEAALSYAEIKMLATGNPLIKEKMDLDKQVEDLKLLERSYYSERYDLEDKAAKEYPQTISMCKTEIKALETDIETAKQHPKSAADSFGGMEIGGEHYAEKKAAGEAILRIMQSFKHSCETLPVGRYRGFDMEMTLTAGLRSDYVLLMKGAMTHNVVLGTDAFGNITRIDNGIAHFTTDLEQVTKRLAETQKQLEIAQESLKEPFAQAKELEEKQERLNELNELLCLDSQGDNFIDETPDEEETSQPKRETAMCR